jgi:predicted O-linked N-acetylglucosamine transferase (SPINDLY family)
MSLKQGMQKAIELFSCGKTKESLDLFEKLFSEDPDNEDLIYNYAYALGEAGKIQEEVKLYDLLLNRDSRNNYDVLINKSIALMELKELKLAHQCALRATETSPTNTHHAWEILGDVEYAMGESVSACESYKHYFKKIINDSHRPILENFINSAISLINLPGIYENAEHIDTVRKKYIENLDIAYAIAKSLSEDVFQENNFGPKIAFKINTFYLAYQQNDDQLLNKKLVKLYQILLGEREFENKNLPVVNSPKKKVLVISTFKYHPELFIFNQINGFLNANYELHCYVINSSYQPSSLFVNYLKLKFNPDNYKDVIHFIQNQRFDFVFMPDIGMSIESRVLSSFKLGDKTFMNWLHPVSSASPYLDYFLSGELMEDNHSDDRYSERLIKLPGIGLNFEIIGGNRREISYSAEVDTFHIGCIQTPFKYHPDFDKVYSLLCLTNPKIKFHFFDYHIKKFTTQLMTRLEKEFTKYGLVFEDHIVIHPRILSREQYLDHLASYHLILDAQGWSGGNTTLDALNSGVPVVCFYKEDGDIRAKHTSSILKMLNFEECCFTNLDDLIIKIGNLMLPGKYSFLRNKFTNISYKFSSCNMHDSIVNT